MILMRMNWISLQTMATAAITKIHTKLRLYRLGRKAEADVHEAPIRQALTEPLWTKASPARC